MKKILLAFLLLSSPLLGEDVSGETSTPSTVDYSSQLAAIIEAIGTLPNEVYFNSMVENVSNVSTTLNSIHDLLDFNPQIGFNVNQIRLWTQTVGGHLNTIKQSLSGQPEFQVNMEEFKTQNHVDLQYILNALLEISTTSTNIKEEQYTLNLNIYNLLQELGNLKDFTIEHSHNLSGNFQDLIDLLEGKFTILQEQLIEISTSVTEGDTNVDADLDEFSSKLTRIIDDWNDRWEIMYPFFNHFYQNSSVVSIWHAPQFSDLTVANDVKDFNLSLNTQVSQPSQPRGFFNILYEYFRSASRSNADQTKALMYISKFMSQENKSEEFEDELESQTEEIQNKQSELEESVSLSSYLENFSFEKYEELYNWGEILQPLRGYVNNENVITLGYFAIPGYESGIDCKIDIERLSSFTDFTRNLFKVVYYFLYALLIWWIFSKIYPLFFRLFDKFREVTNV